MSFFEKLFGKKEKKQRHKTDDWKFFLQDLKTEVQREMKPDENEVQQWKAKQELALVLENNPELAEQLMAQQRQIEEQQASEAAGYQEREYMGMTRPGESAEAGAESPPTSSLARGAPYQGSSETNSDLERKQSLLETRGREKYDTYGDTDSGQALSPNGSLTQSNIARSRTGSAAYGTFVSPQHPKKTASFTFSSTGGGSSNGRMSPVFGTESDGGSPTSVGGSRRRAAATSLTQRRDHFGGSDVGSNPGIQHSINSDHMFERGEETGEELQPVVSLDLANSVAIQKHLTKNQRAIGPPAVGSRDE